MKMLSKHKLVGNRQKGFTLVEMLVVAALIAIFAGLAVFNIIEQLNREKVKAATAEARSIATAMSFAYGDMGFYPKLCFLRFGLEELQQYFTANPATISTIDYSSFPVDGLATKLKTNWRQKYLGGALPEKLVNMTLPDGRVMDWPKDPFGSPYVVYLAKVDTNSPTGLQWIESAGDKPTSFAGVVSYGRNRVPGGKEINPDPLQIDPRYAFRLFTTQPGKEKDPQNRDFTLLSSTQLVNNRSFVNQLYRDPAVDMPNDPNIRENGSDDRYIEF